MDVLQGIGLKLNIGCGARRIPEYTGVDMMPRSGADIVAPAHAIPLPDGCAEEVMAIHLVEHLYRWQVPDALAEWARLLKPGGMLVIEAPDLMKFCKNILEGFVKPGKHPDQQGMWAAWGDDRLRDEAMVHKWGYTFSTLAPLVEAAGFDKIRERETVFHAAGKGTRDFRLEARRTGSA